MAIAPTAKPALEWDWDAEHADRKKEAKADAAMHGMGPFLVDRKLLKDVVHEKMGVGVARITFLSSGTFHKAYLITLVDTSELVARVARRFMPRLKTESEVATLAYLRENTKVPVPTVYHYDANPYNRLGGEYILMSKAPGVPLSRVYHSMAYKDLVKLIDNVAAMVVPLFGHRFPQLGSLYFNSATPGAGTVAPAITFSSSTSSSATPRASDHLLSPSFPFAPAAVARKLDNGIHPPKHTYKVGPIISWPFFGSGRGDIPSEELSRGPWSSTHDYLVSCAQREIQGVKRENDGRAAPHRLHLDPDEIHSSRHHHLNAVPGDRSDDSDEYDLEESEEEWEGPGDAMYRDYRRIQRSTFLVTHLVQREETVKREMGRWVHLMERLNTLLQKDGATTHALGDSEPEEFGLDCHDLSLENVFVDPEDNTRITCVIDWESTTTRPLWACAHLPAFLQSSTFMADVFRQAVARLATTPPTLNGATSPRSKSVPQPVAALAAEWLHYESAGTRLRHAHRVAEWDGWEEGLADSILGAEDLEEEWLKECDDAELSIALLSPHFGDGQHFGDGDDTHGGGGDGRVVGGGTLVVPGGGVMLGAPPAQSTAALRRKALSSKLPFAKEKQKEQVLDTTGDICGGRGGELGRRLEAWLTVGSGRDRQQAVNRRTVDDEHQPEYEAEAE
ncbi:hypothetical protein HGRIS_000591 [Hohenbuehelia grisea]|uniref:Aminoglycoside phosphotransferase domain-containing protein n=1 Tax=Hohenbuehelia grisea TaxID=104357 RepID=A0ABR3JT29_9AGAR